MSINSYKRNPLLYTLNTFLVVEASQDGNRKEALGGRILNTCTFKVAVNGFETVGELQMRPLSSNSN